MTTMTYGEAVKCLDDFLGGQSLAEFATFRAWVVMLSNLDQASARRASSFVQLGNAGPPLSMVIVLAPLWRHVMHVSPYLGSYAGSAHAHRSP